MSLLLSNIFKEQLGEQSPFGLEFSHIGLFLNDPLVLFFGVVTTRALQEVRRKTLASLSVFGEGLLPHFQIDHWTPHCTLAFSVEKAKLADAVSLCEIQTVPFNVTVNRIGIIDTPAEIELSYISLN